MGSEILRDYTDGWNKTTWGELVELKYGKSLKDYKDSIGEYPVFGTNGLIGRCDNVLCEYPGVIVGRKGAYRGVHYSSKPFFVIDTAFYVAPKKNINLKWAYYSLLLADINSMDSGSAIPSTSREDFYALPAQVPPRDIQDAIVMRLDALNDKIELNRQINTTLEAMAQALFKSWFVDFDPVIDNALAAGNPIPPELAARAERRQQYRARANTSSDAQSTPYQPLPADIQQQFPNRFVFTEAMGWVPEGWSIKKAEDIATVSIGKTPPRKEQEWFSEERDGNVVWVSIRDMGSANAFIGDSAEYLTPESISKFNVKKVPKDSVLLSFKLTLGRVSIAQCEMTTNEAIAHFVNPEFGISREFLYCYLITFDYGRLGSTSSIATAVNSKLIKALPVLVPSHKVLDEFSSIVAAWFDQISQINMETNTLVALRDSLLPKLLSGQLRIPDAEAAVDKVLAEA